MTVCRWLDECSSIVTPLGIAARGFLAVATACIQRILSFTSCELDQVINAFGTLVVDSEYIIRASTVA